jgi:protein disulfide-isomerase
MKRFAFAVLAACLLAGLSVSAAETNSLWIESFPTALTQAKAETKLVLADFNGSDWCPPCKLLKKNVLSTPAFEAYAKTNLVLLDVDFPRKKAQSDELKKANAELRNQNKVTGYPTLIIFDATGKELKRKVGYSKESVEAIIEFIESAKKK